ncbi:twin-arginine translocation pathway signal [Piscinibacter gummiphilus]|uniref:Twin-arginine translocation pathway signal n=1 Tax=Piscinibacter gummiphilus TaxID=946333 RepID=A0A1W6LIB3_9BURK|nr:twin-arginine translocation pathway signal [Piscinibacter gummiphilus]
MPLRENATVSSPDSFPPIVFVHGNGDTAALWFTTVWRFESNGWPRDRLHAIDLPYPLARDDEHTPQPGRTSSAEHMAFLAAEVERVRAATGARRVLLVANSRGGYAVRNYLARGGGADKVSHVVLGGTPNHGVWTSAEHLPHNEFNGAGPLLRALNEPGPDGHEVTPGVAWLTLRSDGNDKYCQPTGHWIGVPHLATGTGPDSPELRGAVNVVVPGVDHRETSYGPEAFAHTWAFLTGAPPATLSIEPEPQLRLDGKVSGFGVDNRKGFDPTNLPLVGARLEVFATHPDTGERLGPAVHVRTIGPEGRWGPMTARPGQPYEFVITADGYPVTHVYRSPFVRSSELIHLRAERLPKPEATPPLSRVTLSRPRGFFDRQRDRVMLDGQCPPPDVPPGVAGVSVAVARVTDRAGRTVQAEFNGERIAGLAWPLAEGHLVTFELHH